MSATELNTNRLVVDLKRIVNDSEALLHATKDAVGEKVNEVRERLSEALDDARQSCRRLEGRAIESAKAVDRTIREYPYQSIGIALGVGLLIGALVARK